MHHWKRYGENFPADQLVGPDHYHTGHGSPTLQAKKQVSGTLRITMRKVDYEIRLQIYTFTVVKKKNVIITYAAIS